VGLGLPHSINDIEEEIRTLHAEMMSFGQEIHDQVFFPGGGDRPRPGISEDKTFLYQKAWRPVMNDWLEFREIHKDSFWQNLPFSGAWDRIQDFRQKLIAIRNLARGEKLKVSTPDPIPPKRDPDLGDAVKNGIYVLIGVGGLVAFRTLTKN
jgi:hypothetical protein